MVEVQLERVERFTYDAASTQFLGEDGSIVTLATCNAEMLKSSYASHTEGCVTKGVPVEQEHLIINFVHTEPLSNEIKSCAVLSDSVQVMNTRGTLLSMTRVQFFEVLNRMSTMKIQSEITKDQFKSVSVGEGAVTIEGASGNLVIITQADIQMIERILETNKLAATYTSDAKLTTRYRLGVFELGINKRTPTRVAFIEIMPTSIVAINAVKQGVILKPETLISSLTQAKIGFSTDGTPKSYKFRNMMGCGSCGDKQTTDE